MEGLFLYVVNYILLTLFILGSLLLFPFFPMLTLIVIVMCMMLISIFISLLPEKQEESGVERLRA
ncbi:hypothetical protein P6P90_13575 [Ectobacillus antri]|jgi:hypothetical protein|uniref:Uncharacterized protein n=1 Tax=Ectobacillus antri TaxID=2486280 RepID=A0ABT6H7Z7_9BACI|nr:hypothetical protein [Ectobacillus antri]MDG4657928.1 hypothetical protein [Ectobacillus antri]MDG5754988.1 hypothetical protein [Ectobacillus antri]